MKRLDGKRALITGAASGIGRAAATLFAAEGARLTLCDVDEEAGEAVAAAIRAEGGEAEFVATDATEPAAVQAAVARAVRSSGALHVLYSNAGGTTARDGKVTDTALEEFWRTIGVDLFGTFLGCRFAIPHLEAAGGGSRRVTGAILPMDGGASAV